MIRETPTKLDEPSVNASTRAFSFRRLLPKSERSMMTIVIARKDAAMVGNHQPWLITPHTMIGNAATKRIRMSFFCQLNSKPSLVLFRAH